MVNFRDPVIAGRDYRTHVIHDLRSGIQIFMKILTSDSQEPLSYYMRHIPVRSILLVRRPLALTWTYLNSSWEYFTTLHYELDVIRGHRPCRWTTWVCNGRRLLLGSHLLPWAIELISCFGRFTPFRAWPPLWP